MKPQVAVLVSGRGSNLQALLDGLKFDAPYDIRVVISNVPEAPALARAAEAGVEALTLDHRPFKGDRPAFEAALHAALQGRGVEIVALAGFMRVLTAGFVTQWQGRMINIHPSLLPSFPGLDTHKQALDAGVKLHGCTVHYVTADVDSGPILGQAAVPVLPDDTPDTLAARVLTAEHLLYPNCLAMVAAGREDGVRGFGPARSTPPLANGFLAD